MENLNAEQVINALKYCTDGGRCLVCLYDKGNSFTKEGCMASHMRDALALINSQETEYNELYELLQSYKGDSEAYRSYSKTLEKENEALKTLLDESYDTQNSLTEENERLKSQRYYMHSDGRIEMIPTVESVKADTVRKMQERLNEQFHDRVAYTRSYVHDTIDQIAKEMLEGKDDNT